jgi:cold shock CspA family protein
MTGTILWFDYRDGYGIAVGDDDSEYYIDSSVIDHPEYAIRGVRVSFVLNVSIRGTNCGKDVRIDLDHAAQLQYRIVESLQAYGADKLRPGAIEAALNRLSEIVALKSKEVV